MEHKLRLTKLNNIFLTRADSAASNGLPGLFLTMAETATAAAQPPVEIALFGPPRVAPLMSSIGTVVSNARHCRVATHVLGAQPADADALPAAYEDEYVRITPIVLRPAPPPEAAGERARRHMRSVRACCAACCAAR